jgi:F0F1-type ATP synthase delta subunit
VFQINRNLIGGMRIFADGKVVDNSWLSRINYISSLT